MTRKARKKKWIASVAIILLAALFPAQASSPRTSAVSPSFGKCGQEKSIAIGPPESPEGYNGKMGTCDAGGNCCYGHPEAPCTTGGGGLQSV
jgi:hypothetical protein